jgi:L-alanine-DL-glutamate epimerase-like enolase superfamily enzyme
MKRSDFLKTMATAAPAAAVLPGFSGLAETEKGKVRITDVKCMRVQMSSRGHVLLLVKIETDAGVYGIGECHHDVTGLGAKDVVENALKQILVKQDPFDIARLTEQMKFGFLTWEETGE